MLECVSILVDRDQSTPPSCCSSAWSQILVSQLLTLFQPAWWQLCTGRASERVWSRARVICRPRFPPSYSKTLPLPSCQRFRQRPCKNPALEANPSGPQYFHQKKKKGKSKQSSRSSYLCASQACKVPCPAAARGMPWEEWPLFSPWHFVACTWGSSKALLFSAGPRSITFSPFPVTQDPTRGPFTSFGTELEQGWAKSSLLDWRRKGVDASAWALVGISSLQGSH